MWEVIVKVAGIAGVVSVIGGVISAIVVGVFKICKKLFTFFKGIDKKLDDVRELKLDVRELKDAQRYLFKSSYASLDGLIQLHANGPVTKARNDLNDYMIERKWHE